MERLPHLLIEGLIVSGYALGVKTCYIYIRGEFKYLIGILEKAIAEARKERVSRREHPGHGFSHEDLCTSRCRGLYLR